MSSKKKGYTVIVVLNPTTPLAGDVAVTKRAIGGQDGPVLFVVHSYSGCVVTQAGADPNVAARVDIATVGK